VSKQIIEASRTLTRLLAMLRKSAIPGPRPGGARYMHLACTGYPTCLRAGELISCRDRPGEKLAAIGGKFPGSGRTVSFPADGLLGSG
jgi:hypothetical protein